VPTMKFKGLRFKL